MADAAELPALVEAALSEARSELLARVTEAISGGSPPAEAPFGYRRAGTLAPDECVALFAERVGEYRADVRRLAEADVAAEVAEIATSRDATRIAVAAGVPSGWRPSALDLVEDDGLAR